MFFPMGRQVRRMSGFGEWLGKARKHSGLSQEKLGRACGVTGSYVSRLENDLDRGVDGGPHRPAVEIVDALALALGVTRREARAAAGYALPDDETISEAESRLLERFRRLPSVVQEVVELEVEALYQKYQAGEP